MPTPPPLLSPPPPPLKRSSSVTLDPAAQRDTACEAITVLALTQSQKIRWPSRRQTLGTVRHWSAIAVCRCRGVPRWLCPRRSVPSGAPPPSPWHVLLWGCARTEAFPRDPPSPSSPGHPPFQWVGAGGIPLCSTGTSRVPLSGGPVTGFVSLRHAPNRRWSLRVDRTACGGSKSRGSHALPAPPQSRCPRATPTERPLVELHRLGAVGHQGVP